MPTWFRAGLFAALFVFATTPSPAAEKTFQDDALDDAAITLEAELKDEAGAVEKPLVKLKQEAEALLKRQDLEGAANVYVQIVTVAPNDAKAWRQLAAIWLLIPATEEDDGSTRVDRRYRPQSAPARGVSTRRLPRSQGSRARSRRAGAKPWRRSARPSRSAHRHSPRPRGLGA